MHENMKSNNEDKKKELARKYEEQYGLKENIAEGIIERYGTIRSFLEQYGNGKIENKSENLIASKLIKIKNVIDIDRNDNKGYSELAKKLVIPIRGQTFIYSSKILQATISTVLKEKYRNVIERIYGLTETMKPEKVSSISEDIGTSRTYVYQIRDKALRILRTNMFKEAAIVDFEKIKEDAELMDDKKTRIPEIEETINGIKYLDIDSKEAERCFEDLRDIMKDINERQKKLKDKQSGVVNKNVDEQSIKKGNIKIADIGFSTRIYNVLNRGGIKTLDELLNMTYTEVLNLRNMGDRSAKEIVQYLEEKGLKLKEEKQQERAKEDENATSKGNTDEMQEQHKKVADSIAEAQERKERDNPANGPKDMTADNKETEKQAIVQRILELQRVIRWQQKTIDELKSRVEEL